MLAITLYLNIIVARDSVEERVLGARGGLVVVNTRLSNR